jgi:hypothetical protein
MKAFLLVGGLVAAGFDERGEFLLTVSHAGRGVFRVGTWERVARDYEVVYPVAGSCAGIGPLASQLISVTGMDPQTESMRLDSPDGAIILDCESSGIA